MGIKAFWVLFLLIGCSSMGAADDPNNPNQDTYSGGSSSGGAADLIMAGSPSVSTAGTSGDGNDGTGGDVGGFAGSPDVLTEDPIGSGGSTTFDPPSSGGSGTTSDGVPTGGTGTTSDPGTGGGSTEDGAGGGSTNDPGSGGGSTDDGAGGTGNTEDGSGGTGNTDDGSGGTGNTDDGSGGTGNTDDGSGGTGGTDDGPPPCMPSYMDNVNVLVFEDATLSGADTEGRLFIGGDADLSWTVGTALEYDCSRRDLIVDGNLTWNSGSAPNGMVSVGGTVTRATGVGASCGIETNADAFDFATAERELNEYSSRLTLYPSNGTVSKSYGQLLLVGTDPEVNVFELDATDFIGTTSIEMSVPEGAAVIVNVSGTNVALTNFGFGSIGECKGGGTQCHMIIWNMYEAETVSISGIGMQGTLLAPLAAVDLSNGMIDGQLIVRTLTGSGEHHPYMFTGCYELQL